jgi:hypothetical protein
MIDAMIDVILTFAVIKRKRAADCGRQDVSGVFVFNML